MSWDFAARIPSPEPTVGGFFGCAVDVDRSPGSDVMIVGARRERLDGVGAGKAYVFRRDSAGAWVIESLLTPETPATENDDFGQSVALHGDWAFVGAPGDDGAGVNAGTVIAFRRVAGVWSRFQVIVSPRAEVLGEFGAAIGFDGTRLVVGAYREDGGAVDAGRVHVFEFSSGAWAQVASVNSPTPVPTGEFGCAVAVESDAICVGAQRETGRITLSGQATLFRRVGAMWTAVARVASPASQASEFAGASVALSSMRVVLGVPLRALSGPYQGCAQLFDLAADCDGDLVPDLAAIADGAPDCNANSVPDACDIAADAVDADGNGVPDECEVKPCPADITGNGVVSGSDLALLLDEWGSANPSPSVDLDGDGFVGASDLAMVLSSWGPCP